MPPDFKLSNTGSSNSGITPAKQLTAIPISGNAAKAINPLGANGTWSSGWLDSTMYGGVETTLYTDQDGSYTISYSEDGGLTTILPTVTVQYPAAGGKRTGQFPVSAPYLRFDYTNGPVAQTKFKFQIDLLTQPAQSSAETLNAMGSDTRTAQWTKSRIETKTSDGSNDYAPVYRTGNSLNVHQTNSTTVTTVPTRPSSANVTTATSTATVSTLVASNSGRMGLIITCTSGTVFIKLGTGATTTNYTARLTSGSYYELPMPVYTGAVTAIGVGTLNVTETV